ncbi:hypothetical protein O59_001431 [Cellvibrio sp. BR]|jgi:hypothetical protein|uniref:zf-HC2 domain-containing protein n=1 Tax=unclassified Cellvibrio TaxID=2624793 RepID=UPI0002601391|nr:MULTISPECIES: zf-HC2 domain-containing protein [unclassified Cellvibrio]EIK45792.1 hypothetical protein O59_001431 [Cellvibrio sp. BR]UUA73889.1 zf-HC2 domain-containing protein [Cellvibrio sp. QJXJ]
MLSCKQVASLASDYLENNTPLKWQIRLHLLMCANCRRFVKHLDITRKVSAGLVAEAPNTEAIADAEKILQKVKAQIKAGSSAD